MSTKNLEYFLIEKKLKKAEVACVIDEQYLLGAFLFRGINEDIELLVCELKKVYGFQEDEIKVVADKGASAGFYSTLQISEEFVDMTNWQFVNINNILKLVPSIKVRGFVYKNREVYEVYSESGYDYFSFIKLAGSADKYLEGDVWFRSYLPKEKIKHSYIDTQTGIKVTINYVPGFWGREQELSDDVFIKKCDGKFFYVGLPFKVKISKEGQVTGYVGLADDLILPSKVKSIGRFAFNECVTLKRVIIPDGVTQIDYNAFWGCVNLTDIEIPASVCLIDKDAFQGCKKLCIHGTLGTAAEQFAKKQKKKFERIL